MGHWAHTDAFTNTPIVGGDAVYGVEFDLDRTMHKRDIYALLENVGYLWRYGYDRPLAFHELRNAMQRSEIVAFGVGEYDSYGGIEFARENALTVVRDEPAKHANGTFFMMMHLDTAQQLNKIEIPDTGRIERLVLPEAFAFLKKVQLGLMLGRAVSGADWLALGTQDAEEVERPYHELRARLILKQVELQWGKGENQ